MQADVGATDGLDGWKSLHDKVVDRYALLVLLI